MKGICQMDRRKRKRKGFTLIEIIVVAVILALLGSVVVPGIVKKLGKAKHNIAKAKIMIIHGEVIRFQVDCGRLPSDFEEMLYKPSDLEEKWDGPYLTEKQLLDPWGNPYEYYEQGSASGEGFDIISYGADGMEGGEGENADIYNDQ